VRLIPTGLAMTVQRKRVDQGNRPLWRCGQMVDVLPQQACRRAGPLPKT
jgi:hypothetical protein